MDFFYVVILYLRLLFLCLFQKDLVEGKGTTYLARDLTQDKVKNAAKVCLFHPICVFQCYWVHDFDSSFFPDICSYCFESSLFLSCCIPYAEKEIYPGLLARET